MKPAALLGLAVRDLGANKSRAVVSMAGIALGVAVLLIIAGLGLGARDLVLEEVVRALPLDTIEVVPRTIDLGIVKVNAGGLLGGIKIDAATLERLRALPHVAAAYPKLEVDLPLGAEGGMYLFKRRLHTDLFMTGLPAELLAPEVGGDFKDRTDYVPVVVSDQLIEVYNSSVAPAVKGPQLNAQTLKGFRFDLVIGRSMMLGTRGAKKEGVEKAVVAGVSRYAMRFGVTVPLETARRILRDYAVDPTESYASILLKADSPASVPAITDAVKNAGLSVDETAERTGNILGAATGLASLVGLLVLALAALNIAHSFFASLSERRRELAIMRATGARRTDLVGIVLAQAVLLGLVGAVVGGVAAVVVAQLIDWAARVFLPSFPFKPESFFSMPASLFAWATLAAVVASALGALWPAVRAARTQVARALAEA